MNSEVVQGSVLPDGDDEGVFQTNEGMACRNGRESSSKVLMSVPNPKRTVPVSFLSLPDEDSYSPFLEEPLESAPNSSLHMQPNQTKPNTAATPEVFAFSTGLNAHTNGSAASNADQSVCSRGIIGSTRKLKSSNSFGPADGEGSWPSRTASPLGPVGGAIIRPSSTSPAPSAPLLRLHGLGSGTDRPVKQLVGHESGTAADSGSGTIGLPSPWDSVQYRQHMPICRPSSTPAYPTSITSLFKANDPSRFELDFEGGHVSSSNDLRSSNGGSHFSDLLRSSDATSKDGAVQQQQPQQQQRQPVRGRDRDYSFGSLLGLSDLTSRLNVRNNNNNEDRNTQQQDSNNIKRVAFGAVTSDSFTGDNENGNGSFFDFQGIGDGSNGGLTQRESLRAGLGALGGTVSAPPMFLTSLYATDEFSFDNGISTSSARPANTLSTATTYASVIGSHLQDQISGNNNGNGASSRTHSPLPIQQQARQSPVPGHTFSDRKISSSAGGGNDAGTGLSSVEGAVLRSCREILAGAADRSLKAVELANTLRARVGTESLARVREQWGGLLSLLEKHSSHFRVDRIPKNDKVTLISSDNSDGDGDDAAAFGYFGDNIASGTRSGDMSRGNLHKSHASSLAQSGDVGASSSSSATGATRCLHVGNVPANMSEVQLMREFEKFGQLDGLKLVSQRNGARRFAFVTFHSIEQAITARHCLSKVHPWKSAISFAHKEFTQHGGGNGGGGGGYSNSGGPSPAGHLPLHHQHHHQQQQLQHQIMLMRQAQQLGMTAGSPYEYGPMPDYQQQLYQMQQGGHQQHIILAQQQVAGMNMNTNMNGMSPYGYMNGPYGGSAQHHHQQQQLAAPYWMQQLQQAPQQHQQHHLPLSPFANPGHSFLPLNATSDNVPGFAAPAQAQLQQPHPLQPVGAGADVDCPVLRRLCDDTYVPTQPWPVDAARDQPYIQAVVAQLQHFDGYTTISKLRGFLRNRVAAVDNIKSVPLKAMLLAYPQYFTLVSNYVHLVNNSSQATAGNGPAADV